jgi:hypothetical protein
MDHHPIFDQKPRTEAQFRVERYQARIEPRGPCDQQDNEPRAVQRRWDLADALNELSKRLDALASELDTLTWALRDGGEPDKKALRRIAVESDEFARDLRAFAEAI